VGRSGYVAGGSAICACGSPNTRNRKFLEIKNPPGSHFPKTFAFAGDALPPADKIFGGVYTPDEHVAWDHQSKVINQKSKAIEKSGEPRGMSGGPVYSVSRMGRMGPYRFELEAIVIEAVDRTMVGRLVRPILISLNY